MSVAPDDLRWKRASSTQYEQALHAQKRAQEAYALAVKAYRAKKIGDAEFLAARKMREQADKAFDEAFEAESGREEEPTPEAGPEPTRQIPLF